jgi:PAS domain S-box-containing protein
VIEGVGVLVLLALTSIFVVTQSTGSWLSFSPGAAVLPLLLWLAARSDPTFAIAGAFVASGAVICATNFGIGRFGDPAIPLFERAKGAQAAVMTVTAYTLFLAALFAERRQREMALKMAVDGAKLGAFSADLATGNLRCDLRTATMHGHTVPPATIKESRRFVHRDDLTRIDAALAKARGTGGVWNAEYRVMHPPNRPHAGETRWVAVESSLVCDSQGVPKGLLGVTRDITHQKQAEQTLAERNAQLTLAGKFALVGSFAFDVGSGTMRVSPGYAAIHDLPEDTHEISRDDWRRGVHPADLPCVDARFKQAMAEQRREHYCEYRIVRSSGEIRWIDSRSLISYDCDGAARVVGANIDVTQRKQTEAALEEHKASLADALAAGQVMAFDWDAVTGQSRRSDNSALILGIEQDRRDSSPRNEFLRWVHPDDRRSVKTQLRQLCPSNPSYALIFRFCCPNGEQVWLEETAKGEFDATGKLLRIKGLTRDITERKRREGHQRALVAELDHRVKNVLATVSAVAGHTLEASSSMSHFVAALDGRIRSMATAHELLSTRQWQGMPMAELVRRELAAYASNSNTKIDGPEVMLNAEAGQAMAMVIHELVTNAAKYGALSTQFGHVLVRWYRKLNGDAQFIVTWQETGGPRVEAPRNFGYGTVVVRDLIPYEFGGTVDLSFTPEGVRYRLEIPFDRVSSDNRNASAPERLHHAGRSSSALPS